MQIFLWWTILPPPVQAAIISATVALAVSMLTYVHTSRPILVFIRRPTDHWRIHNAWVKGSRSMFALRIRVMPQIRLSTSDFIPLLAENVSNSGIFGLEANSRCTTQHDLDFADTEPFALTGTTLCDFFYGQETSQSGTICKMKRG